MHVHASHVSAWLILIHARNWAVGETERDSPDGNPESESPVPSSLSLWAWVSLQSQGLKLHQNSIFVCYLPPRHGVAME